MDLHCTDVGTLISIFQRYLFDWLTYLQNHLLVWGDPDHHHMGDDPHMVLCLYKAKQPIDLPQ